MKPTLLTAAIIFILLGNTYADRLPASRLPLYGRCIAAANGQVELIGSASHLGFYFTGKECAVEILVPVSGGHNYVQYELDGVYQNRIKVNGNDGKPFVITAATSGHHRVWIYKTTEAASGPVFIGAITGTGLRPMKASAAPLIEFIGNSITCGAQADASEYPCNAGGYNDHHNAYYAYGPRVARALGLNFTLSSVSGIGIYRNWDVDGPTMPQVYEKADFQLTGNRRWDFSREHPSLVSIALGTNDFSHGDGHHPRLPFDSAAFVNAYCAFIGIVKSKHPSAQILLLNSPTVHGQEGITLQNCLKAVVKKIDASHPAGKRVAVFFFTPMTVRGCSGHPSVEDHALMAEQLKPFLKRLL